MTYPLDVISRFASGLMLAVAVGGLASAEAQAQSQPAAAKPDASTQRFGKVTDADIQKLDLAGCSFTLFRGRDMVAVVFTDDPKRLNAIIKLDGKLTVVPPGTVKDRTVYWNGNVAGTELRLVKGPRNPRFKSDGGSQSGEGRLDWKGPAGPGTLQARWEEGC